MSTANLETAAKAIITLIEADAASAFGSPLLTFLTADAAANGDILKQGAALVQLQSSIVAAAPTALGALEGQLATAIATRVQALATAATAGAAAAQATLAGTTAVAT